MLWMIVHREQPTVKYNCKSWIHRYILLKNVSLTHCWIWALCVYNVNSKRRHSKSAELLTVWLKVRLCNFQLFVTLQSERCRFSKTCLLAFVGWYCNVFVFSHWQSDVVHSEEKWDNFIADDPWKWIWNDFFQGTGVLNSHLCWAGLLNWLCCG